MKFNLLGEEFVGLKIIPIVALTIFMLTTGSIGYYYCNEEPYICLYSNGTGDKDSLNGARLRCVNNESVLLEIYDRSYQYVIDDAFRSWISGDSPVFLGSYLWLNMEKIGGVYKWNGSGRAVTYTKWNNVSLEGANYAYISFSNNQSSWFPAWDDSNNHPFICMQDSSFNLRLTSPTPLPINTMTTTKEISKLDIGLIAGLVSACVIIIVLVITLVACYCVKKKNEPETRTIPPTTNVPNFPESVVYLDGVRKKTLSFKGKKRPNTYVTESRMEIIKNFKPPKPGGDDDFVIYETVKSYMEVKNDNLTLRSSGSDNYFTSDMHV